MDNDNGEVLFERLCAGLRLSCHRVAEAAVEGESRPDYLVTGVNGTEFIAEVKTITPTTDEARDFQRILRREAVVYGGVPGARLRRLIDKANAQIKALGGDGRPGVLVVFNSHFYLQWHTDRYAVLTAMRGLDVVDVAVPHDPSLAPVFGDVRPGPRRKMTPNANTTTSAIVCPVEREDNTWQVDIFHNSHASQPLPLGAIVGESVMHWKVSSATNDWTVA